jgi:hypothetical protein
MCPEDVLMYAADVLMCSEDVLMYAADVLMCPEDVLIYPADVLMCSEDILCNETIFFFEMCLRNLKAMDSVQSNTYVQFISNLTVRKQIM